MENTKKISNTLLLWDVATGKLDNCSS